jgi:anti-sigma factor ChrR (cupin superfamily)
VWDQGPAPGIVLRTLFLDAARQYATQLIRLAPGTQVEPHWHADAEECYVLEGSFSVDTSTFQAGDYVRMPAGSAHNTITSDTGCLLLVMASPRGAPQN